MNTIADIIPPILVAQTVFWLMVVLTLAGAVLAVIPLKIVHNILGLALAMFGVTGIYLYLGSQFVAMMQLLVYVGAICITYIFAIMLSPPLESERPKQPVVKATVSLIIGAITFVTLIQTVLNVKWAPYAQAGRDFTLKTLGQQMLSRYFLVFELISLLLAVAIIGSIMVAGIGQKRN
jgi:NADH-quinone oxidoreductase subunit J